MDGNGRWARRGLRSPPATVRHEGLRRTVEAAIDLGVGRSPCTRSRRKNWTRPPDEVEALMEIFGETIERELPDLARQGVRTRFMGRRTGPRALRQQMALERDRRQRGLQL